MKSAAEIHSCFIRKLPNKRVGGRREGVQAGGGINNYNIIISCQAVCGILMRNLWRIHSAKLGHLSSKLWENFNDINYNKMSLIGIISKKVNAISLSTKHSSLSSGVFVYTRILYTFCIQFVCTIYIFVWLDLARVDLLTTARWSPPSNPPASLSHSVYIALSNLRHNCLASLAINLPTIV